MTDEIFESDYSNQYDLLLGQRIRVEVKGIDKTKYTINRLV